MNRLPLGLQNNSIHRENTEFVNLLENLEKEDLGQVTSRLIKNGYSKKKAEEARIAFLRFISFVKISDGPIAPIPLADSFWHEFILFTQDYFAFCYKHFGRYIHHQPRSESNLSRQRDTSTFHRLKLEEISIAFLNTINLLGECFGDVNRLKERYIHNK